MQSDNFRTLKEVCSLIADCPHSTPVWTEAGFLVIRNQNIKGGRLDLSVRSYTDAEHFAHRIRRAKPQYGDLIITREAPMGEVCMVPRELECCVGQRQVLLRPSPKKVDPRFLLYAIQSPFVQHQIRWNEGTGSTVSNIRIPVLESIRIPLPSLDVQTHIADTLGSLDDRITLLRETNATLEAIAQALFKSWFVDFDPVRAKAEGREPEGVPPEVVDLFPDELVESDLGMIPKGWPVEPIGNWISFNPSRKLPKGTVAPYLDMANIPLSGWRAIEVATREVGSGAKFTNGDTLLARITPCLENGKTCFVDFLRDGQNAWGSTEYIVLRTAPEYIAEFSYFVARDNRFREHAISNMSGTSGRQRVPAESLERFLFVRPDPRVTKVFGAVISPVFQAVREKDLAAKTLTDLRDTLLPRLMSGKLRIAEAEKELEAV